VIFTVLRSLLAAILLASVVLLLATRVLAPGLPRVAGAPAFRAQQVFGAEDVKGIEVVNRSGQLRVATVPGRRAEVRADIRIFSRTHDGKAAAEQYAKELLAIETSPSGTLRLISEPSQRPAALEVYVDIVLAAPEHVELDLHNDNGNVLVEGRTGPVRVHGRNSDVSVKALAGPIEVETLNGRIRLDSVLDGAKASTVNGSIYAYLHGGALEAETTNGAVIAHVVNPAVGSCTLQSRNGGITVTLQEGVHADIDAATEFGSVRCDYALEDAAPVPGARRLNGSTGTNAVPLHLQTLNGNIWVTAGPDIEPLDAEAAPADARVKP
jgi:hypothetical protein